MRVRWSLTDPSAPLPASVTQIQLVAEIEGEAEPIVTEFTRDGLGDVDMDGRPDAVFAALPARRPFTITINAMAGGVLRYVGHVGPLVLREGERRYLSPLMYELGRNTILDSTNVMGRVLHTATALPDGRVLVAGGFDSAARAAACPAGLPAETVCYALRATRNAFVFDPTTGRFFPVGDGGLLEARGGHTATALADGRVLLTGGASSALLIFVRQTDPGFAMVIRPETESGAPAALATFELFDPELGVEDEDVDSDGDPGRGKFVGAADAPTTPGRLDRPRFLSAAARLDSRVIIAGGDGASDTSYAVFDLQRAGGYGVHAAAGTLQAARSAASAIGVGAGSTARVWIFGGTRATSNADLAEVWTPGSGTMPVGTTASAADAPLMFPQQIAGGTADHPEWSLARPLVETVGASVLVAGWYGPLCMPGSPMPLFSPAGSELCGLPPAAAPRGFTVDVATGLAAPTATGFPHAFGASARLDDGTIVLTGGLSSIVWSPTNTIDVFTGMVGADRSAVRDAMLSSSLQLMAPRALHTSTALPHGGVLTVGGITFGGSASDATMMQLVGTEEALFLSP
jgi:hypothetical protein